MDKTNLPVSISKPFMNYLLDLPPAASPNAGLVSGLCQSIPRIICLLALGAMHDIEMCLSLDGWVRHHIWRVCCVKELQVRSCSLTAKTFHCPTPWLLTDADGYL